VYLLPTFNGDALPSWYYFEKKINLGLDLKGGAQFVYSIDLDVAVDDKASGDQGATSEIKLGEEAGRRSDLDPVGGARRAERQAHRSGQEGRRREADRLGLRRILQARPCSEDAATTLCMRIASSYADSAPRRAPSRRSRRCASASTTASPSAR
jgi:hypothetical protein